MDNARAISQMIRSSKMTYPEAQSRLADLGAIKPDETVVIVPGHLDVTLRDGMYIVWKDGYNLYCGNVEEMEFFIKLALEGYADLDGPVL